MTSRRQQTAFFRKLYLAHMIAGQHHNLLSLHHLTQMPRRTIQDSLADFSDLGIVLEFVQDGPRNNSGYYRIVDWGPINPDWVSKHLDTIQSYL
ncbi:helix-turn-helix domain-containing protein [Gynuella sunshinyii]|uniref:Helix-turn-helix domain-containing protein n=1 Tax=Gynuella sunshinyii YC6258 TaxID=1445510 RepID=A0A0C5VNP6_9GAMM|nr:helix-turn-helix domain-containing protein [Gynuella sunshinyii]AJQ96287.1 hypothetical protein YC6258_04253 [Gynuella sunshinyii YC6258]